MDFLTLFEKNLAIIVVHFQEYLQNHHFLPRTQKDLKKVFRNFSFSADQSFQLFGQMDLYQSFILTNFHFNQVRCQMFHYKNLDYQYFAIYPRQFYFHHFLEKNQMPTFFIYF